MRFEGTLDLFGLADILQLLSHTRKTGTLHVRRPGCHGAVHVLDGAVTGGRSDVGRQALGRRLLAAGPINDEVLADAAAQMRTTPLAGLGRLLAERAGIELVRAVELAAEQAVDAVFDLLRWPDGEFAFGLDELDPDDLGARLPVEQVVAEALRRLASWPVLTACLPAAEAVVAFAPAPGAPPVLTVAEWQLLSAVDGRRSVAELVALSGRGDYATVGALAALVERGLLETLDPDDAGTTLLRRQAVLAEVEAAEVEAAEVEAAEVEAAEVEAGSPRPEPSGALSEPEPQIQPLPAQEIQPEPQPEPVPDLPVDTLALIQGEGAARPEPAAGPIGDQALLLQRLLAGVPDS